MLPDTLHTLPQSERFAYAKLLAHVTRIDDELSIDEMLYLNNDWGLHFYHQISAKKFEDSSRTLLHWVSV